MSPRPRKLVGPLSEDSTQIRRGDQRGTPTQFPVVEREGVIGVQVDPRGAIGTDPVRGINVRTGGGLGVETGSPYRLVALLGAGLELVRGRIGPRLSTSVRTNTRGQLVATPTTAEVTDPDGGTAQQTLARKANVADARFPALIGIVALTAGVGLVLDSAVASDSVVLLSHGTLSGTQGLLSSSLSDGYGMAIQSSSGTDAGTVHYAVWNTA